MELIKLTPGTSKDDAGGGGCSPIRSTPSSRTWTMRAHSSRSGGSTSPGHWPTRSNAGRARWSVAEITRAAALLRDLARDRVGASGERDIDAGGHPILERIHYTRHAVFRRPRPGARRNGAGRFQHLEVRRDPAALTMTVIARCLSIPIGSRSKESQHLLAHRELPDVARSPSAGSTGLK